MYQNDPMKVLTGEVRLSYMTVITPKASQPGEEAKYSVKLLIPKTDMATKADIDAAIQAAAQEAAQKTWDGSRPPMFNVPMFQQYEYPKHGVPVYDGDTVNNRGEPYKNEENGHWVISASTKIKPQVVGMDNINVDLAPSDIYSGMYGRVTIRFFGYSHKGNKGVGCGLGNIMKTRDGEPLAGNASAASDFATVGNAVVQPQTAAQPFPWGAPAPAAPLAYPQQTYQQTVPQAYPQQAYQQPAPQAYQQSVQQGYQQQPTVTINPLTGQPL